jgi:YkoY family integral membrane protein
MPCREGHQDGVWPSLFNAEKITTKSSTMGGQDVIVIINLFIIESLLSVDNAAVLAVMVEGLPARQQKKALRYGIAGAYLFRGGCLLLASYLIKILWIKILGGAYLVYLALAEFLKKDDEQQVSRKPPRSLLHAIIMVEIMDIVFSVDNIFAAVAMSKKIWVIMAGVGMGILAMRFVAGWFTVLMKKHATLKISAYIVVALLGVKLLIAGIVDYIPGLASVKNILDNHYTDLLFSGLTVAIFFFPMLLRKRIR